MRQQSWTCEKCSATGCVEIVNENELTAAVKKQHKEKSPWCTFRANRVHLLGHTIGEIRA